MNRTVGPARESSTESSRTIEALVDVPSAESTMRTVNGVRLHAVAAGDPSDPLVVLLHGFPEFWYGWKRQLAPLVDAGFRVLVPDQRGYNRSEKPRDVRAYRISELSRDVVDLVETEGRESAHVVGHDWGALVAWDLARRHPSVVDRLCAMNTPHYSAYQRVVRSSPSQLLRSSYGVFFQLPWVPEFLVKQDDFAAWTSMLQRATRSGTFTDADLERYRDAWRQPGALNAMLNWYRALLRHADHPEREQVDAPTLVIWGKHDPALLPELAELSLEYCTDGRLELWDDAGHFVQHDRPERVARYLVDHLDG